MSMKVIDKILGTPRTMPERDATPHVKTTGNLLEWCKIECQKLGLELYPDTLIKEYDVYKGEDVIGRYDRLSDIKKAIKDGSITESYNL